MIHYGKNLVPLCGAEIWETVSQSVPECNCPACIALMFRTSMSVKGEQVSVVRRGRMTQNPYRDAPLLIGYED